MAKHNFHLFQNKWENFIKGKKFYRESALLNFFAFVNYEDTPIINEELREISGGNLNIKKWNGPVLSIKKKEYGNIHFPECPKEYKVQDVKNEIQIFRQNILKKNDIYLHDDSVNEIKLLKKENKLLTIMLNFKLRKINEMEEEIKLLKQKTGV